MELRLESSDTVWLDFVIDLTSRPLDHMPDEQVTRMLVETFDAPAGGYYWRTGTDSLQQRTWPSEHFAPHRTEIEHWTATDAPSQHPILRYYLATGAKSPIQVSDVPVKFADRRVIGRWHELGRRWGDVTSQVSIPLSMRPNSHRAFLVGRSNPFTGGELRLARRLQRLLVNLEQQVASFSRWKASSGADGAEAAAAVHLTPRELGVLDLLADGLTAASIGHRLGISERTVQKHLQRCYAKLGVADRLAAVQRAHHSGIIRAYGPDRPFHTI